MGIQDVDDVTLIRHAYVRTDRQCGGMGGQLLMHLLGLAAAAKPPRPLLIGTWAAARWAVAFYEHHGFVRVTAGKRKGCCAATGTSRRGRWTPRWCSASPLTYSSRPRRVTFPVTR